MLLFYQRLLMRKANQCSERKRQQRLTACHRFAKMRRPKKLPGSNQKENFGGKAKTTLLIVIVN
jgi:hypothetical protein